MYAVWFDHKPDAWVFNGLSLFGSPVRKILFRIAVRVWRTLLLRKHSSYNELKKCYLPSNDWIDNNMVLTSYRALHFSLSMSKQILPCVSTFGWKQGVVNLTFGAVYGYPEGNSSFNLYLRPAKKECYSVISWVFIIFKY